MRQSQAFGPLAALLIVITHIVTAADSTGDFVVIRLQAHVSTSCDIKVRGKDYEEIKDLAKDWKAKFEAEVDCNTAFTYTIRPEYGVVQNLLSLDRLRSNQLQYPLLHRQTHQR